MKVKTSRATPMINTVTPERAILSLKFLNVILTPFELNVECNIKSSDTINKIWTRYQKSNITIKRHIFLFKSGSLLLYSLSIYQALLFTLISMLKGCKQTLQVSTLPKNHLCNFCVHNFYIIPQSLSYRERRKRQ